MIVIEIIIARLQFLLYDSFIFKIFIVFHYKWFCEYKWFRIFVLDRLCFDQSLNVFSFLLSLSFLCANNIINKSSRNHYRKQDRILATSFPVYFYSLSILLNKGIWIDTRNFILDVGIGCSFPSFWKHCWFILLDI